MRYRVAVERAARKREAVVACDDHHGEDTPHTVVGCEVALQRPRDMAAARRRRRRRRGCRRRLGPPTP